MRAFWHRRQWLQTIRQRSLSSNSGSKEPCPYTILGLPRTASPAQLKRRFFELSLLHHPDKIQHSHGKDKAAATEQYLAIKAAYEVLKKHRQPETTSGSDDGSYTEPQKERNDDAHPNQNSFRVIAPWFYGLFGIGALVSVLGASVSAQRAKATKEAWDRYTQQRAEEGLGRALGYEEDEEVLREVKGQEESHILFRALRSHSVSKTVGKHVLEEPGRGD